MKKFITYVDEAGNTGDNLIDSKQPFFVIAAVSVPEDKIDEVEKLRKEQFDSVREKEEVEIKGTRWAKATNKQPALRNIIYSLLEKGGDIHISIVEKRYMIVGWAINTFFDYVTNHSTDNSWMCSPAQCIALANEYYNSCSDEDLNIVGYSLRKPAMSGYEQIIDILKRYTTDPQACRMLEYTKQHLSEIYDFETEPNREFIEPVFHSANLTSFQSLGNILARTCRDNCRQLSLIFDDCALCNEAFDKVFEFFTGLDRDLELPNNNELLTWKGRILGFNVAKSEVETLIQIADIVASSVEKVLQKVSKGTSSYSEYEKFVLAHLFVLFDLNQVWLTMSDSMNRRVFNSIKGVAANSLYKF